MASIRQAADPAYTHDVMLEQLDYLFDHMREHGVRECSECQRYLRVRTLLLETFADPPAKAQLELPRAA